VEMGFECHCKKKKKKKDQTYKVIECWVKSKECTAFAGFWGKSFHEALLVYTAYLSVGHHT
jgi:hypothetical protein